MNQERTNELIKIAQEMVAGYKEAGFSFSVEPMQRTAAGVNPWQQDPFDPFHGPNRGQPRRRPSQVPDSRMLFDIQRDLRKGIDALKEKDQDETERQVGNAWRLLNRYLRQYVTHPQGHQDQDYTSF